MAHLQEEHVVKRKRKKSFLQKQKQFGKKGRFGQGVHLSEEDYQYFIRILEVLNASKDSADDMETLANNVLEEISGKEVDTSGNQMASRVIEDLIAFAPNDKLKGIATAFGKDLRIVFVDPYCSHVLQKLAVVLTQRIISNKAETKELIEELTDLLLKLSKFALSNLEEFIYNTYANHVLRTLFACVNGRPIKEDAVGLEPVAEETVLLPEALSELAVAFADKIASMAQLKDIMFEVLPAGCLQALLLSVRGNPKLSKKLTKRILEVCEDIKNLDLTDEENSCLLHVIEAAIVTAPPKYFNKLFKNFFENNLKVLAGNKLCNFAVQKLLLHCPVKECFESMMEELNGSYDVLLSSNHTGSLLAMAKTCRRHKTKEGEFSKNLFSALRCEEPPERRLLTTPLIYTLTRYESYNQESSKVHLHGSLIVQEMLQFTKPIRLVTSLLNTDSKLLFSVLCDPRGCHITDAFCDSQYVGEKNREKLCRKLEKHYAALASSKHGSRSFDAIWKTIGRQQKLLIMDELKASQSAVVSTNCGRLIASKVRLDLYRSDKEAWMRQNGGTSEKISKKDRKQKKMKRE